MAGGWSRFQDIDRLADGAAEFDYTIPLADLSRLHPHLASLEGEVSAHLEFRREFGCVVASLVVRARPQLQCQRCLRDFGFAMASESRVALVANANASERVPAGLEPVLAAEGQVRVVDLVEEEVLLGLPLIARHADDAECNLDVAAPEPDEEPAAQTPFAGLGELLKRKQS